MIAQALAAALALATTQTAPRVADSPRVSTSSGRSIANLPFPSGDVQTVNIIEWDSNQLPRFYERSEQLGGRGRTERGQGLDHRAVRRRRGQVVATAAQHECAVTEGLVRDPTDECGLADSGLAADQGKATATVCRGDEQVAQQALFAFTTGDVCRRTRLEN